MAPLLEQLSHDFPKNQIIYLSAGSDLTALSTFQHQLERLRGDKLLCLNSSNANPFADLVESSDSQFQLINFGAALTQAKSYNKPLLCSLKALLHPIISPQAFIDFSLSLELGTEYDLSVLLRKLLALGYQRVSTVNAVGEFALKGELLDLYAAQLPWRITFDSDKLERIRVFEPWNQRSLTHLELDEVYIPPISPYGLSLGTLVDKNRDKLRALAQELEDGQRAFWLSELASPAENAGVSFLPWLIEPENLNNLFHYIPPSALLVMPERNGLIASLAREKALMLEDLSRKLAKKQLPQSQTALLEAFAEKLYQIPPSFASTRSIGLCFAERESALSLGLELLPQFRANAALIEDYLAGERREKYLLSEAEGESFGLTRLSASIDRGFALSSACLFTDFELFGRKPVLGARKKGLVAPERFIPIDLDAIAVGDHLVHLKHGIGRFLGLRSIELAGTRREYLSIEYRNGDQLNVPVEQMNNISQFRSPDNSAPQLSKLGGQDWEKAKTRARKKIEEIAEELIALYAERSLKEGFVFEADSPWQRELEDAFPYNETPDQLRAVAEIKADMEAGKIMDRLLCGDVGFGKTEVVLRVAFKAILSGKQVALLAPTTILAHQHFRSFQDRYRKFPLKVEYLTRAKSTADRKRICEQLKAGELDLIIGTHTLLGKELAFKDLGLLVIDEEQKFGVKHKEKLKQLKSDVSVLTVSATPIPRSMHIALSGIHDMSIIATAPPGRVPVKTQIVENEDKVIRAAILRELERGGQVFHLHNRVESINQRATQLMQLVPEASFRIVHGQMSEGEIDQSMEDFVDRKYDVLLCTSIIENGLDIPNANTLIVEDAQNFGLSQLYQLRGRVGRANDPTKPGYALLLAPSADKLTPQAKARLEAIARYGNLGAGYQISLRDMEIRGVGNLLGTAQHGKVEAIGFELYSDMLRETVERLKLERNIDVQAENKKRVTKLEDKPVIDLKLEAHLPSSWFDDESAKLREYRRLAEVKSLLELTGLQDEWVDRFGELNDTVLTLLQAVRVRLQATSAGIRGTIRALKGMVDLRLDLTFAEWKDLRLRLPKWLLDKLAFRSTTELGSSLLLKVDAEPRLQLNALESLCDLLVKV